MPSQKKNHTAPAPTPAPNTDSMPRTRPGNANKHPGLEMKEALKVRPSAEVQREKMGREERRLAREQQKAHDEQTMQQVAEHRAQQQVALQDEESSMPRHKPQGT